MATPRPWGSSLARVGAARAGHRRGVLTVTQATNIGYAGAISGNGSLTKTGAGTLTLTGNNNYQGGTTVSAGTLAGTTASLQGDILDNANVSFDQALGTQGGYGSHLSGSGSLTKTGAGMLFLTNTNSYSGGTVVMGAYSASAPTPIWATAARWPQGRARWPSPPTEPTAMPLLLAAIPPCTSSRP